MEQNDSRHAHQPPLLTPANPALPAFAPVPVRARHDGWSPDRQLEFIEALAECGCVDEACRRVGMTPGSAYALRLRGNAGAFRLAWRAALDHGVDRLADAAFSRALHGVSNPIFYKGEQVGERRYFDERLTMFLLRYRDPVRYGKWLDAMRAERHPDATAVMVTRTQNVLADTLHEGSTDLTLHGLEDDHVGDEDYDDDDY
jgi:hypothetical protein